jgi:hypothetical protein
MAGGGERVSRQVKKARTPLVEGDTWYAIELPGEGHPEEFDVLTDQAIRIGYDRLPGRKPRWRLRTLQFDKGEWTKTGIRRWWAEHEVVLLAESQLEREIPEVCRGYDAPSPNLPAIFLCHRNTLPKPAMEQMEELRVGGGKGRHPK